MTSSPKLLAGFWPNMAGMIAMKYHALFVIFEKVAKCRLLQIKGGPLRIKRL